jgi:hypothetical protein
VAALSAGLALDAEERGFGFAGRAWPNAPVGIASAAATTNANAWTALLLP